MGDGKAAALHRFSACGRSATVLYLHFIHFCNLKRCKPHKKIKNYTVKSRITVYRHSAYRILPIYVNILKFSDYITGFFPTSCNATGLISTFAGLALLFCIKTSSIIHHPRTEPKRKRVPRRKIAKPQLTSDTHIKFKKHYRHP